MGTQRINRILNLVVIMALMLAWQPAASATATSVADVQAAQMLPVENLLNSDGTLNTRIGARGVIDVHGWDVTLDSRRGPILTRAAPAAPNADTWSPLAHSGMDSDVLALAVMGSDLYVGGIFSNTADGAIANLGNIAKYSGGTWSSLAHNGLNNDVYALAVIGNDLYVGGLFQQTKDGLVNNLSNIARYTPDTNTWSALAHNGLNGQVDALTANGNDLYVGGEFLQTQDGVTVLNHIARYSSGAWSAFAHNGVNNWVGALAVNGSDLYAGGAFTTTYDGAVTNLNHIARYNGGAWSALANNGLNANVFSLAVMGSDLYVGGAFSQSADETVKNLNYIARYSGSAWSALAHNGLNSGVVDALAVIGSDLYVGGYFTQTKDGTVKNLNYIARYSGGAWSGLAHNGLNSFVNTLAVSGSDLYAGGDFAQTFDGTVTNLNYIARLGISVAPGHLCYLPLVTR
jgi:trimeric autotransporter adhesin